MKLNKWTVALAAAGLVTIGHNAQAEEGVVSALSKTTLSGFVDTSASISSLNNDTTHWGRVVYQNKEKQNGFNLDVVQLSLESPLDESDWASGYKVDLLFGNDANYYDQSGFGIRQAYVNTRVPVGNGLGLKMGIFDSIVGYEGFANKDNPNYSRNMAYAFQPFNHTGLLADYQVNDSLSFNIGAANTNRNLHGDERPDDVDDNQGAHDLGDISYMASVTFEAQSGALQGARLTGAVLHGPAVENASVTPFGPQYKMVADANGNLSPAGIFSHTPDQLNSNLGPNGAGTDETTNFHVNATIPTPIEGLGLGAAYDHVSNAAGKDIDVDVFALYASYQVTDKMSVHGRIEYLNGDNGIFGDGYTDSEVVYSPVYTESGFDTFNANAANGAANPIKSTSVDANNKPVQDVAPSGRIDNDVEILSLTGTLQYDLWENVLTRVEVRYDQQVDDNVNNFSGDDNVLTLTLNAVYSF